MQKLILEVVRTTRNGMLLNEVEQIKNEGQLFKQGLTSV